MSLLFQNSISMTAAFSLGAPKALLRLIHFWTQTIFFRDDQIYLRSKCFGICLTFGKRKLAWPSKESRCLGAGILPPALARLPSPVRTRCCWKAVRPYPLFFISLFVMFSAFAIRGLPEDTVICNI